MSRHGLGSGAGGSLERALPLGLDAALEEGRHRVAALRAAVREEPISRAALGQLVAPFASEPRQLIDIEQRVQAEMTRAAAEGLLREKAALLRPLLVAILREDQPLLSDRRRLAAWFEERRGAEAALELIG